MIIVVYVTPTGTTARETSISRRTVITNYSRTLFFFKSTRIFSENFIFGPFKNQTVGEIFNFRKIQFRQVKIRPKI